MLSRKVETAIILAATEGTRLNPLTQYIPKVLLPVGDKPIIIHHLERVEAAGIPHAIITLEKKLGRMIQMAIENGYSGKVRITFLMQEKRSGLGYATLLCRKQMSGGPFLIILADECNRTDNIFQMIRDGRHCEYDGMINLLDPSPAERILGTATVGIRSGNSNSVDCYLEKPSLEKIVGSASTAGIFLFDDRFLDALETTSRDESSYIKGEHSIGASIQMLIDEGCNIGYVKESDEHIHFTNIKDFWKYANKVFPNSQSTS